VYGRFPEEASRLDTSFTPDDNRYRPVFGSSTRAFSLVDRVEFLTDDRSNPFSERVLPTVDIQVRSQERSAFVEGVVVGLYAPRALLSGGTARILPARRDRSRSQDADRFAAAIALTASSYQG
jgi:hypothetical protein